MQWPAEAVTLPGSSCTQVRTPVQWLLVDPWLAMLLVAACAHTKLSLLNLCIFSWLALPPHAAELSLHIHHDDCDLLG